MGLSCCKLSSESVTEPHLQELDIMPSKLKFPTEAEALSLKQFLTDLVKVIGKLMASDETPLALVHLSRIAESDYGWCQVMLCLINCLALHEPLGPLILPVVYDDCRFPTADVVIGFVRHFVLNRRRAEIAHHSDISVKFETNICAVLCCIVEKFGTASTVLLTYDVLEYLVTIIKCLGRPRLVLYAALTLEKFAETPVNRQLINDRLLSEIINPLQIIENLVIPGDYVWRQVIFNARWALDNIFVIPHRVLSYENQRMIGINAMLNWRDAGEKMKISSDGLEVRCDSFTFESVRCTYEIVTNCWYYEVELVTSGVMQIGYATRNSAFTHYDGYGIGDDCESIGYDGCRRLLWYQAQPLPINADIPAWKAGDIVGCLIDMEGKQIIFSLNGRRLSPFTLIFRNIREPFFAAASLMSSQQCIFNFGKQDFIFPPTDRLFSSFNDHGQLPSEDSPVLPRRIRLANIRNSSSNEVPCNICSDSVSNSAILPCLHSGFCRNCARQLISCPMCCARVTRVIDARM